MVSKPGGIFENKIQIPYYAASVLNIGNDGKLGCSFISVGLVSPNARSPIVRVIPPSPYIVAYVFVSRGKRDGIPV